MLNSQLQIYRFWHSYNSKFTTLHSQLYIGRYYQSYVLRKDPWLWLGMTSTKIPPPLLYPHIFQVLFSYFHNISVYISTDLPFPLAALYGRQIYIYRVFFDGFRV